MQMNESQLKRIIMEELEKALEEEPSKNSGIPIPKRGKTFDALNALSQWLQSNGINVSKAKGTTPFRNYTIYGKQGFGGYVEPANYIQFGEKGTPEGKAELEKAWDLMQQHMAGAARFNRNRIGGENIAMYIPWGDFIFVRKEKDLSYRIGAQTKRTIRPTQKISQ